MTAQETPENAAHSKEEVRALGDFHQATQLWFDAAFDKPTAAQQKAWPAISRGDNTLLLAPTGSGKTLAAFLVAIDRIMFPKKETASAPGVKTLYISPLKALGVDVERNLRAPLAGVTAVAQREGFTFHPPSVGVRSGDTPQSERTRMVRTPPDILITTPESLYLLLTSKAREILRTIDTVIIDEIHSMVGTKRGSHLFLSLERLERLRMEPPTTDTESIFPDANVPDANVPDANVDIPLQRIGLSATQRPLEEVARLLGGCTATADESIPARPRHVEIIQAGRTKSMEITVEVPVEDMANLGASDIQTGPASAGPTIPSIWPSIHPRLVELIRKHRSTMIFVNSRRLAERMASSINEVAEEEIALAHHGSIAKDQRAAIEDRLKRGTLPAIVATSSLELGIDMGAVDLVIQIESPPSIASGIQRIGRAGHQVGAPSVGRIFPKYRGDLLACSAAVERMFAGEVEQTFYPRNPLDVLAQQIVAMVSLEAKTVDELYKTARSAAPFAELTRNLFESVLDLLSGRYPSNEFSELRPRVNWDRVAGVVSPRKGSQRIAIANGGTIPDRGLYGVFLAGTEEGKPSRVGELDEEMVFETRPGEVFLLGASSWRVVDITQDRVLVEPAPGEPGRMPFWRGDGPGRPLEFGQAIGRITRELTSAKREEAEARLIADHGLDRRAAWNLMNYLEEQIEATGDVPSDKVIVVERFLDEIGDWRVVIMTPFGSRVHSPWATAVMANLEDDLIGQVDMMWNDDGIVFRIPRTDDDPPETSVFFPAAEQVEEIIVNELGGTALFAARFRENAARALLLPRRRPGQRTPLWLQRRKSADLLAVASRYERFPIMLETYRECLRDVFDLAGLKEILSHVAQRKIRVHEAETSVASPFAASLLFTYTGNFLYNGDAPLAERRAATLALDHVQLRELLGDAELRELLDAGVVDELALELQRLNDKYPIRDADGIHDLLRRIGDLTLEEIQTRNFAEDLDPQAAVDELVGTRRAVQLPIAGELRFIAAEDAGRYRDAFGVVPPPGLPDAFLESVPDAMDDIISRYARTHIPFIVDDVAKRFAIGVASAKSTLEKLQAADRVIEGEFLPGGRGREWTDVEVLRRLKQRSLAKLRKQIEPVEPHRWARFMVAWQGLDKPRRGLDGCLDVVEQLQGMALPVSELDSSIMPARIIDYKAGQLDELCAAGEVVWRGISTIGTHDARIALYLTDNAPLLCPLPEPLESDAPQIMTAREGEAPSEPGRILPLDRSAARTEPRPPVDRLADQPHDHTEQPPSLEQKIVELLDVQGALFFDAIVKQTGGFRNEILDAIWRLVWAGHVTNDTMAPLRSLFRPSAAKKKSERRGRRRAFRSRRAQQLPGSEGRWTIAPYQSLDAPGSATATERTTALATQLIERYGIVTRETVLSENILGGFSRLYPIYKAMEQAGRVRRGYFVAGQGAAQFAAPGAEDRLRDAGESNEEAKSNPPIILAATDPANPYGASLSWPNPEKDAVENGKQEKKAKRPQRTAGAKVILHEGILLGYLSKNRNRLLTFLPVDEPMRSAAIKSLCEGLKIISQSGVTIYLKEIDDQTAQKSPLTEAMRSVGFVVFSDGVQLKRS